MGQSVPPLALDSEIFVEGWAQSYGSPYLIADDNFGNDAAELMEEAGTFYPGSDGKVFEKLVFVDGSREVAGDPRKSRSCCETLGGDRTACDGFGGAQGSSGFQSLQELLTDLRESRLLGAATDILRKMSDGRFAFADGFPILDGHTQLTRDPKTLSGGEKFLASLALALGLVELTTRTGARLDALFLDEGFGSVDAAALGSALLELKERSGSGKLIGVITHVRGIASEIEDVIRVQRLPGGSVVTKLTATERNDMMNEAVVSGLLEAAG